MSLHKPYELEEASFVGGTYKVFQMQALSTNNDPIDLRGSDIHFSLMEYVNGDAPIISKKGSVVVSSVTQSIVQAELQSSETIGLRGKYIYQFTVKAPGGQTFCAQGLVTIFNNIDKDYYG